MTHLLGKSLALPITQHPTKAGIGLFSSTGTGAREARVDHDPISLAIIPVTAGKQ